MFVMKVIRCYDDHKILYDQYLTNFMHDASIIAEIVKIKCLLDLLT